MNKVQVTAMLAIFIMVAAYITFLVMVWNQYQVDRTGQRGKIDELLDRLPSKPASE